MVRIYQIDAFAERPFEGNPAAVCLLDTRADEPWMRSVAAEMNLSETAFVHGLDDGFGLRWFTPVAEVELCGHATLASAHALWENGDLQPDDEARFHTMSGLLTARRTGEEIELDFPARPAAPRDEPPELAEALGASPKTVAGNRVDLLVELESESAVRGLDPDFEALRGLRVRGVIVTSEADPGPYDFVSRFFAPALGIDEDPVTGSAHCVLGPFWSARLGRDQLTGYQASRRGGCVRVRMAGDRVRLGGRAVTVLRGELVGS